MRPTHDVYWPIFFGSMFLKRICEMTNVLLMFLVLRDGSRRITGSPFGSFVAEDNGIY